MPSLGFLDRVKSGEILISDGATGTNLQARGLVRGEPAELWVLEQPEQIVQLHRDFISAGAQVILTCTFNASSIRLKSSGLEEKLIDINTKAVGLSRNAADGNDVFIGGSIGPLGALLQPYGPLDIDDAIKVYAEQAQVLYTAGIDLIVIETQFDLQEAKAAIQGIRKIIPVPLICSFSYDRGTRTMMGVNPAQTANELRDSGIDMIGINCGSSLQDNLDALEQLRQATSLPIWFKPNAGKPEINEAGITVYNTSPEMMGTQSLKWINAGANVIGGCCGTSPDHLRKISQSIIK